MSGTPNAEGVKQLLELLDVRAELIERLAELKPPGRCISDAFKEWLEGGRA